MPTSFFSKTANNFDVGEILKFVEGGIKGARLAPLVAKKRAAAAALVSRPASFAGGSLLFAGHLAPAATG